MPCTPAPGGVAAEQMKTPGIAVSYLDAVQERCHFKSQPIQRCRSSDGGASFSGPTQIGTLASNGAGISGRALYAPVGALGLGTESIVTIGELAGVTASFQATGTTPGTVSAAADLGPNVSADIALQGDSLIAALGDFPTLQWSRYAGPVPATLQALNAAVNWTSPEPVGPRSSANLETSLVSGPGGVFLGYAVDSAPGFADFVVRRFTGAGWGAPTVVASAASRPDLHEDPAGRLHALWADLSGLHYRYTTDAANSVWSAPQTVASGESFAFARLAVNAAGNGWAVWASWHGRARGAALEGRRAVVQRPDARRDDLRLRRDVHPRRAPELPICGPALPRDAELEASEAQGQPVRESAPLGLLPRVARREGRHEGALRAHLQRRRDQAAGLDHHVAGARVHQGQARDVAQEVDPRETARLQLRSG